MSRFLAFLVDIPGVAFIIATFAYQFFNFRIGNAALPGASAVVFGETQFWTLAAGSFFAALLIAFVCEGLFGTTLGKLLFGLVVVNARGGYAGLGRALTRGALRPVDLLAIGPLLAVVTPKRQRLGDVLAGTAVSQTRFAPLMTLVAVAAIAALVYAQFAWGGGVDSAIGVTTQTVTYGAALGSRLGTVQPNLPVAAPGESPSATAPASSAAPSPAPQETAGAPASAAPESAAPESTTAPESTPSGPT